MSFLTFPNRCKSLVTQPLTTRVIIKVYWGVKYQEFSITRDFRPFYCIPRCFFDLFSNHYFWKHLVLRSTSYQNHCSNPSLMSHRKCPQRWKISSPSGSYMVQICTEGCVSPSDMFVVIFRPRFMILCQYLEPWMQSSPTILWSQRHLLEVFFVLGGLSA